MGQLLISLIGMSLAASIFVRGRPDVPNEILENGRICETMECHHVANGFLNSMNESVKPCDNFFEFSCGNWHKNNPEYKYYEDENRKLQEIAVDRLRDELELESSAEDISPVHQIRKSYKSCMKTTQLKNFAAIKVILDRLKGWSMIMEPGTWNSSAITSQEIDRYYEEITGQNAFYEVKIDDSPSEHAVLQISPREGIFSGLYGLAWLIADGLIKLNDSRITKEKIEEESLELDKFGGELIKISESPDDLFFENIGAFMEWRNHNGKSNDSQNNINWTMILPRLSNITNLSKTEHTPIRLMNVNYFKELPKLLQSTDKRIIDNLIHLNFIYENMILLVNDNGVLNGMRFPKYFKCDMSKEPVAVYLFNRKYYGSDIKAAAEKMVKKIKEAFKLQITRSDWLSDEAKNAAIEKVNQRKFFLGHEEWYMNETVLIDYYEDLTIGENYVENYFRQKKNTWKAEMKNWGKPIKYQKWEFAATEINGDNVDEFNYVLMPEATFKSPLFGESVPDYFSYGKIGQSIGHELGHAFDSNQYSFFKSGINDTGVKSMFNESAQCFIDLFDKYVNNSGNQTLPDNLADWYGVQAALDAYNEVRVKKHPNGELKLPGLQNYTDHQMFFLSFSQYFCGRTYYWHEQDLHQPHPYRVIGTLSNTKAFAEAFKCPKNSLMNPEKKCDIWKKKSQVP